MRCTFAHERETKNDSFESDPIFYLAFPLCLSVVTFTVEFKLSLGNVSFVMAVERTYWNARVCFKFSIMELKILQGSIQKYNRLSLVARSIYLVIFFLPNLRLPDGRHGTVFLPRFIVHRLFINTSIPWIPILINFRENYFLIINIQCFYTLLFILFAYHSCITT